MPKRHCAKDGRVDLGSSGCAVNSLYEQSLYFQQQLVVWALTEDVLHFPHWCIFAALILFWEFSNMIGQWIPEGVQSAGQGPYGWADYTWVINSAGPEGRRYSGSSGRKEDQLNYANDTKRTHKKLCVAVQTEPWNPTLSWIPLL